MNRTQNWNGSLTGSNRKSHLIRSGLKTFQIEKLTTFRLALLTSFQLALTLDGEVVAEHDRSFGQGETIYDPLHYLPVVRRKPGALRNGAPFMNWKLPAAMQRVRQRLQAFDDGNRQMVSILCAAQQLGFECLEKACQQALAQGCCHADVILNHAHRLDQPEVAKCVSTPARLRLRQPPKADCRRYDELTGGER